MKGLHALGVSHSFGDQKVLHNVSLMVPSGQLVCLLGPSGCGKTTFLRLAAGLEELQAGEILINGKVVADSEHSVPPQNRKIGLMFQDFALFPHLTATENVLFGLQNLPPPERNERASGMLDKVGMTQHAGKYPHMLSGGQQQRVALARALAPEPELLLLDEPFSGLDIEMRLRIREQTLEVLKGSGVATLMVTHDAEEAMFMADRIKVIGESGHVLQAGRPHEIFYHPRHQFVAKLFGKTNCIQGIVNKGAVNTPFGEVSCIGFMDGERVEILIRPEGVQLSDKNDGVPATILSTHLLGHDSLMRVRLDQEKNGTEYHVRVHSEFDPGLIYPITAKIDPEYTFVFRHSDGLVADASEEQLLDQGRDFLKKGDRVE